METVSTRKSVKLGLSVTLLIGPKDTLLRVMTVASVELEAV